MLARIGRAARPSRRQFLIAGAAAGVGLVIGLRALPVRARLAAAQSASPQPDAFVRIAPNGDVTVICKHIEFGQGSHTGLATLVAEELGADWTKVRAEAAPADAALYNNLLWGAIQGTGGSSSMANAFEQMRTMGAMARAMLVEEAAETWEVPASEITVREGRLSHVGSGRTAPFGEFAQRAAKRPPPASVTLKDPKDFNLIGRLVPRLDTQAKTNGTAIYTIDVKLPGMLTALIARPPRFGGKVRAFEPAAALGVPGVVDVVQVPSGIAVLGRGFWAAKQGRDALQIEWDDSAAETRGTSEIMEDYKRLAGRPGEIVRQDGSTEQALSKAVKVIEASYEFPFLAHAPMEPVNCVIRLGADGCEIWTGSQLPTIDQAAAAAVLGLEPQQVTINTLFAGGSFGRRATPDADMVTEAAEIAKAIGGRAPVKLLWTREDDIKGGRYRPMYYHTLKAGLDKDGAIVAWMHRIVGQSILRGTPFAGALIRDGIDQTSVEGAQNIPYAIPNLTVDLHTTELGIPVLWWRSVGSSHTAYAVECFMDELVELAHRNPVGMRLLMLKDRPRHQAVLKLAAEKANWQEPLGKGRGRGVALHESFSSIVAQVAEVAIDGDGKLRVERVVCAVDCGLAVNPDVIKAQMEGGIGYGLGAILHNAITLEGGVVQQTNFDDYLPLRIDEMPRVEVHIVPSSEAPTGVGEPGVPPIGPAVANAVYAATGRRIRSLPFAQQNLRDA
ncbi:MAG: molybdopterin cofactor-binding domain-containing protein [Kiloniellales bacterium]